MTVSKSPSRTSITDPVTGVTADVNLISGVNRLATDTLVTASVQAGIDPIPDSWFRITDTGTAGSTIKIDIAATTNDPSSPDRDLPAFSKTFTTGAGEVGDEVTLGKRIVTEINADAGASSSEIRAQFVKDDENVVVFITSKKRGEFFERSTAGDFNVTTTGTAAIDLGFNTFVSRSKQSELARSVEDPRVGVLAISGSISVQPGAVADRFELELENSSNVANMNVNGSVTPVTFSLANNASYDNTLDYFITTIIVQGLDNGIKLQNFLGLNSPLGTGLTWDIRAEDGSVLFPDIRSTRNIKRFASLGGWYLDVEASADDAMSIKDFGLTPIRIAKPGTFTTDDKFEIDVNDDLTSVIDLRVTVIGFTKEL